MVKQARRLANDPKIRKEKSINQEKKQPQKERINLEEKRKRQTAAYKVIESAQCLNDQNRTITRPYDNTQKRNKIQTRVSRYRNHQVTRTQINVGGTELLQVKHCEK